MLLHTVRSRCSGRLPHFPVLARELPSMRMMTPTSLSPTMLLMAPLVDFQYLILPREQPFSILSRRQKVLSVPLVSTQILSQVVTTVLVPEIPTTLLFGALKPSPGATTGEAGGAWAFQMPPATAIGGPTVTKILETTGWRHTAPPLLASMGQYAYWMISRSAIRAWYGSAFTIGADGEFSFGRGNPAFKAAPYTGAINGDSPTILCGGPADAEFACMDATNINEASGPPLWTVATGGTGVYGDPVMSPDFSRVYWMDDAGLVSSADPSTGGDGWTAPTGVSLLANPVMSSDGGRLFFADVSGTIVCWDVAETTLPAAPLPPAGGPTTAPQPTAESVAPPTDAPSSAPSAEGDTRAPSMSPAPTESPTVTPAPVEGGGAEPTAASSPTPAGDPTSASSSVAVFSVIAASIVAALFV